MLAALECVDLVVIFEDKVPRTAVELAHPDIYVKGGDYRPEDLPEAKIVSSWGGKTITVTFEHERSTTNMLKKIRASLSRNYFLTSPEKYDRIRYLRGYLFLPKKF